MALSRYGSFVRSAFATEVTKGRPQLKGESEVWRERLSMLEKKGPMDGSNTKTLRKSPQWPEPILRLVRFLNH